MMKKSGHSRWMDPISKHKERLFCDATEPQEIENK